MQKIFDYGLDYTEDYRAQLHTAVQESQKLGFKREPRVLIDGDISDSLLEDAMRVINQSSAHWDMLLPGYWGNSCQALSTQIFAELNSIGLPAEIIIGNVHVNGTDEFDSTLQKLQADYLAELPMEGAQELHAWVSLGGDTIVDAALPPRLVKYYAAPEQFNDTIFIHRAGALYSQFRIRYEPLLVGTEFFAKTNPPDPLQVLETRIFQRPINLAEQR